MSLPSDFIPDLSQTTNIPGTNGIAGGFFTTTLNETACTDLSEIPTDFQGYLYVAPGGKCFPYQFSKVQQFAQYGYNPKVSTGVVFCVIFGFLLLIHIGLTAKSRRKWLIVTAIGAMGELIGWIGRALSGHRNDASIASGNYFLVQIVCLTITPVFFSATCYGLFVILVANYHPETSRFTPRFLTYVFVTCDIISLVIQAAGGGITSNANTRSQQQTGTHIFLAGIIFQLIVMIVFFAFYCDYFIRLRHVSHQIGDAWANSSLRTLAIGTALASLTIIIRGIYRTAELAEGWEGMLVNTEKYFLGLDAAMMVLCVTIFAATHPAFTLPVGPKIVDPTTGKSSSLPFWRRGQKTGSGAGTPNGGEKPAI